jgi:hypothetical protein
MANTFTNTGDTIIANAALEAFTSAFLPLTGFSVNLSDAAAARGDKVKVLSIGSQTAAADFAGTYTVQNSTADGVDVTLNKHKFVSWGLTDTEISKNPQIELEKFGRQKGFQLAKAVFQDILSLVTVANYGAAVFTGAANTFDKADVLTIKEALDLADWDQMGRTMALKSAYFNALLGDSALSSNSVYGGGEPLKAGSIPSLYGFQDIRWSNLIPANAENLVGFAALPDAMLLAMRYLQPQEGNTYFQAGAVTDPGTGITLGFRDWYDNDAGERRKVLECVYGYTKGNGAALKRFVSA